MMNEQIQPPKEDLEFTTNEVLREVKKKKIMYYLPCYVRFKVKELLNVNIEQLTATVSGTLLVTIYYGNMNKNIVEQFTGQGNKAILLQFSRQESMQLREEKGVTFKEDEKQKRIDFVIRTEFNCYLIGDVFLTPFEVINLYLTITFQTVTLDPKNNNGNKIDVKFNCMSSQNAVLISHGQKTSLGLYSMATHFLGAKYTNKDKNPYKPISVLDAGQADKPLRTNKVDDGTNIGSSKKLMMEKTQSMENTMHNISDKDQTKIKPFQYAHFRIPLYKHPGTNLFEIFVPLWILAFINLVVFFQQNNLADKLAIIATITLAFIAFVPTINEAVPNTPQVKLIDILIYLEVITTILTIIDSVITARNQPVDFIFQWSVNGWFIATMVIDIIVVFIVIVMFIVHKVFWERVYIAPREEDSKNLGFARENWGNEACDEEFYQAAKKGKVAMI